MKLLVVSSFNVFTKFLNYFSFMIPGGVIWLISIKARVLQILFYFISVLFVPLIPMCIATCMGILIILVSSFLKIKIPYL